MHNVLVFLLCAALFALAIYGLLKLYAWRNGGLYPWQNAATSTPSRGGSSSGAPPATK